MHLRACKTDARALLRIPNGRDYVQYILVSLFLNFKCRLFRCRLRCLRNIEFHKDRDSAKRCIRGIRSCIGCNTNGNVLGQDRRIIVRNDKIFKVYRLACLIGQYNIAFRKASAVIIAVYNGCKMRSSVILQASRRCKYGCRDHVRALARTGHGGCVRALCKYKLTCILVIADLPDRIEGDHLTNLLRQSLFDLSLINIRDLLGGRTQRPAHKFIAAVDVFVLGQRFILCCTKEGYLMLPVTHRSGIALCIGIKLDPIEIVRPNCVQFQGSTFQIT